MRVRWPAIALPTLLLAGLLAAIILPSDDASEQPAPSAPTISGVAEVEPPAPRAVTPTRRGCSPASGFEPSGRRHSLGLYNDRGQVTRGRPPATRLLYYL